VFGVRELAAFVAAVLAVLSVAASGCSRTAEAAREPAPQMVSVNRTVPSVAPPAVGLHFSPQPSDAEFLRTGLFREPLVPVGPTGSTENQALAQALLAYNAAIEHQQGRDQVLPLTAFLDAHPRSPWRAALLYDLGAVYRETGHFSRALATWQAAWDETKALTDRNGRALGDASVAALSQFEAYLGRKELLQPLLDEIQHRELQGTAAELVSESRRGMAEMVQRPEISFRCGPMALERIVEHGAASPSPRTIKSLQEAPSTANGLSLPAVKAIAARAGMRYQMAYRSPGAPVVVPAVTHWKVGHYAGLVGKDGVSYQVEDPTFGENIEITPQALDDEASGYFLVPAGKLPQGWRTVAAAEGAKVWGRGNTGTNKDNNANGPSAPPAYPPKQCTPCTTWNVEASVVGLSLADTPIRYTPPVGPAIAFGLHYSHRDTQQPATFAYTNFGRKWTTEWLSYVTVVNATSATLYQRGGGAEPYTFASSAAASSATAAFSQAVLTKVTDGTGKLVGFTRQLPDGSTEEFRQPMGTAQFFMTAFGDPQGNKVTLTYDAQMRIMAVTDAVGEVTTLAYGLATDPLKVTSITDPFGRTATFTYTADGANLASITDMLGITSSYTYGPVDFVNTLQTPYGTTTFAFTDNPNTGSQRILTATDALGRTSRVEFRQGAPGIGDTDPAGIPTGMSANNVYLEWRNTFVWDPNQLTAAMSSGTLDYTKAKIFHWLHTSDGTSTSRIPESVKEPLEHRVWFDYPGQSSSIYAGSSSTPLHSGRRLDDGTTQLRTFTYNAIGRVTSAKDPAGRQLTYGYAANNVDLLSITNTTGGRSERIETVTYNAQHEPLTVAGANGVTASYTYNTAGQPLTFTDGQGHVTTYTYDGLHRLITVQGPDTAAKYSFTYDSANRVATATDPAGATVSYLYDAADRPTSATFPDGTSATFTYNKLDLASTTDRLGHTTTLGHDAERQLTTITDPLAQVVILGYAPSGQLGAITDPLGHVTTLIRDLQSRVTSKQYADGTAQSLAYEVSTSRVKSATDALNQTANYLYNLDDSLASVTYTGAQHATPAVSFTYDPVYPRLATMTDGTGITKYAYNPVTSPASLGAGRLLSVTSPVAGATSLTDALTYGYDELDRVVAQGVNDASQAVTYDPLGRVTSVTNSLDTFIYSYADATPRVSSIASTNGPQVTLGYFGPERDELLKQMDYRTSAGVSLSSFTYTYDANANVTSFTQTYLGQILTAATGSSTAATVVAKGATSSPPPSTANPCPQPPPPSGGGKSAKEILALATALATALLAALAKLGKLPKVKLLLALLLAALVLVLVAILTKAQGGGGSGTGGKGGGTGGVTQCGTGGAGGTGGKGPGTGGVTGSGGSTPEVPITTYQYDTASRLVSATVGSKATAPQFTYQYDAASNLTSITRNGVTQTASYTTTNALTSGTYDANGSPTDLDGKQYTWDAANRLLSVTKGTHTSLFTYDGLSRMVRIVEQESGTTTADRAFFWCGDQRCLEHDNLQAGSLVTKQFFGQGVIARGESLYYVTDQLGSVRQLVGTTGTIRAQYDYDPYGNATKLTGDLDSDIGFAGYLNHPPSGLEFALFRAYDPSRGTWISRDPIGEKGGVNLYGYVGRNPTTLTDQSGETPLDLAFLAYDLFQLARNAANGCSIGGDLFAVGLDLLGIASPVPGLSRIVRAAELPGALRGGEALTHVYFGVRDEQRVYVGITNDLARRAAEHGERFELVEITSSPVTRGEARAIEQALIERNPGFENIRNSISPNHPWYDQAVDWGESWLTKNGF